SASYQYRFCEKLAKAGVDPEIINNYAKDPDIIRKSNKIQKERHQIQKIAKLLRPEQDTNMYSTLFVKIRILKKQLEDYHSQPNTLEKRVKRLEKDVRSLKDELKVLDECVDRETVITASILYEDTYEDWMVYGQYRYDIRMLHEIFQQENHEDDS
ncbi:2569_t:CDS:2, partial [Funneliformis geosporum]